MYSANSSKRDCIFCRIIAGEVPTEFLYQDEEIVALRDINPKAPTHLLVMPRAHIPSLAQVGAEHQGLLGRLLLVASELAKREGVSQRGYRVVINSGAESGQEVPHLHLHILGGRPLTTMG